MSIERDKNMRYYGASQTVASGVVAATTLVRDSLITCLFNFNK